MKKTLLRILTPVIALCLTVSLPACSKAASCGCPEGTHGAFAKGSGSEANPFRITSAEQLAHISLHPDQHFRLDRDILLKEDWQPLCQELPFTGHLDGNRKIISGLQLTGGSHMGLFAKIGPGGYVQDLTLEGIATAAGDTAALGALAGENMGTLYFVNSQVELILPAGVSPDTPAGGLVGINRGLLSWCDFTGSITDSRSGGSYVGAMAGFNDPQEQPGLPVMITAHSGFAAEKGASDKSEDNTIDSIIKSICLQPDAIEVDVRLYTDSQGNVIPVLAHDADMVCSESPRVEEVLQLLLGNHPRASELTENGLTIPIQLDCKEDAAKKVVFDTVAACGFPLSRVIIPVGNPQKAMEDLEFWQEKAALGAQLWIEPTDLLYSDPQAYADTLDALEIRPLVVNLSYKKVDKALVDALAERGYGMSIWTLNSRSVIDKYMTVGAFNITSRLEESLKVREGLRTGFQDCSWDMALPQAGSPSGSPQDAAPQPRQRSDGSLVYPIAFAAAGILLAGAAAAVALKIRREKKHNNKKQSGGQVK